jgi:hypothetical protein
MGRGPGRGASRSHRSFVSTDSALRIPRSASIPTHFTLGSAHSAFRLPRFALRSGHFNPGSGHDNLGSRYATFGSTHINSGSGRNNLGSTDIAFIWARFTSGSSPAKSVPTCSNLGSRRFNLISHSLADAAVLDMLHLWTPKLLCAGLWTTRAPSRNVT